MILYRYLKAEDAISTLERGFLKTSRCSDFNDPFELAWRPALTATEAVNEFIKTRPETSEAELQACHKTYESLTRFTINACRDDEKSPRIVCFSSEHALPQDEIMMWSHYADKHGGIRLGFELSSWTGTIFKMNYERDLLKIDIRNLQDIDKILLQAYGRKSHVWGYESEYRLYVSKNACEEFPINIGGSTRLADFIKIKDGELISVTIGARFKGEVDELKKLAKNINQHVALYKAEPNLYEYKLDYHPLNS